MHEGQGPLCPAGCLEASLASALRMPVASSSPVMSSQMTLGGGGGANLPLVKNHDTRGKPLKGEKTEF